MYREVGSGNAEILLVEDYDADVRLVKEMLKETGVPHQLHVVGSAEDALDFVGRRGRYMEVPRPDLVLLDLNLPRKSGIDVLQEMKQTPVLRRIPVIVLSSSSSEADVNQAYELGANAYMRKPSDLDEVYNLVLSIRTYWLQQAVLPNSKQLTVGSYFLRPHSGYTIA
jgi:two-component system, chemotaxis family, response regulator Rcp1